MFKSEIRFSMSGAKFYKYQKVIQSPMNNHHEEFVDIVARICNNYLSDVIGDISEKGDFRDYNNYALYCLKNLRHLRGFHYNQNNVCIDGRYVFIDYKGTKEGTDYHLYVLIEADISNYH